MLFPEVDHHTKFSINVYAPIRQPSTFVHIANLFAPQTIDVCMAHVGGGPYQASRREEGGWETAGHRNRVIEVDEAHLATFAKLYDAPGIPPLQARLPAVHSHELISVLEKFAAAAAPAGRPGKVSTSPPNAGTNPVPNVMVLSAARPASLNRAVDFVLSGPHFFVGNPLNKTPRRVCNQNSHYDVLDLDILPRRLFAAQQLRPACDAATYCSRIPRVGWMEDGENAPKPVTAYYRHVNREMVSPSAERTSDIGNYDPGVAHINTALATAFSAQAELVRYHAMCLSIAV